MYEDVGSGEGFQSGVLLVDMLNEELLQLVDDKFFVLNFSIDWRAQFERDRLWLLCVVEEHQWGFSTVAWDHPPIENWQTTDECKNTWRHAVWVQQALVACVGVEHQWGFCTVAWDHPPTDNWQTTDQCKNTWRSWTSWDWSSTFFYVEYWPGGPCEGELKRGGYDASRNYTRHVNIKYKIKFVF